MKERNIKHEKRLKKLILTCLLLAVVLTVGTYAWFIGMQTVAVEAFEVKIAAVDDLSLSLDGKTWGSDLTVNESVLNANEYAATTSSWTGLKPVSSIGEISDTSSKLVMYDKGSLTATDGGYRLMAALVKNGPATIDDQGKVTDINEEDGYVAFDLFIKNMSGDEYYTDITDPSNEEAIYLYDQSSVTAGSNGTTDAGVENSVRIAFAQIGRVKATTTDEKLIQKITCAKGVSGITPICSDRYATIWEPNDTIHNEKAIKWFETTCYKRNETTGSYLNAEGSKNDKCTPIVNGTAYPTYAVSNVIDEKAGVDVYDGFNGYAGTIANEKKPNKLMEATYFTDTDKIKDGLERPTFFTLAPNSITKVRVYIYLEGQDLDNYDFASLGYSIMVNFGFTKERFTGIEGTDTEKDSAKEQFGVDIEGAKEANKNADQPQEPVEPAE